MVNPNLTDEMVEMLKDWIRYNEFGEGDEVKLTGWKNYFAAHDLNFDVAVGASAFGRILARSVHLATKEFHS